MTATQADDIQQAPTRLYSLDALRGFDMFWIMGADALFQSLSKAAPNSGILKVLADQLEHPLWNGIHFYDLIFPHYLFMAGVSTTFLVGCVLVFGFCCLFLVWCVV